MASESDTAGTTDNSAGVSGEQRLQQMIESLVAQSTEIHQGSIKSIQEAADQQKEMAERYREVSDSYRNMLSRFVDPTKAEEKLEPEQKEEAGPESVPPNVTSTVDLSKPFG